MVFFQGLKWPTSSRTIKKRDALLYAGKRCLRRKCNNSFHLSAPGKCKASLAGPCPLSTLVKAGVRLSTNYELTFPPFSHQILESGQTKNGNTECTTDSECYTTCAAERSQQGGGISASATKKCSRPHFDWEGPFIR